MLNTAFNTFLWVGNIFIWGMLALFFFSNDWLMALVAAGVGMLVGGMANRKEKNNHTCMVPSRRP